MSPSTLSCTNGTGLGRPVVPDVNEIAATPAGDDGASAVERHRRVPGAASGGEHDGNVGDCVPRRRAA